MVQKKNKKSNLNPMVKRIYVRKNYLDSVAVFFYALGCSLVHFVMFLISFVVETSNVARA
jgi:hypothetical protein